MPVLVLFYQENGLDLQDVFIVQAFFSVCIIVFEVPSGYFADRLGRRQSMLIGTISAAIGFGIYAFSDTLPEILCAQFFIAIGGSFISGSDTALLYDTLIELKQADQYQRIAGRLGSIGNFSEGIAGLVVDRTRTPHRRAR
jgi:MFS family permease